MRSKWVRFGAICTLAIFASTCRLGQQINECPVTITLTSPRYATAGDVDPVFGPSSLVSVLALQPGPEIIPVRSQNREDSLPAAAERTEVRLYSLDTGLWTSAWDTVSSTDAAGIIHIPPGTYRIRLRYMAPNKRGAVNHVCVAQSDVFSVERESTWHIEQ